MRRLGLWSVGLSSGALLLGLSALHGVDAGLSSLGLALEVGGLVFAGSELEDRASRHGRPTMLARSNRWVRRRLGLPGGSVVVGVGSAKLRMRAGAVGIRVIPRWKAGPVEERLRALERQVENLYANLGHVSDSLGRLQTEREEGDEKLTERLDALEKDVPRQIAAAELEGIDGAWFGLMATAAGVLLSGVAQVV